MIETKDNDSRPYLSVRIFGKEIKALLDSGATKTILGREGMWILDRCPARLHKTSGKYVETADAMKHEIGGMVDLAITLKGRTEQLTVLVVPALKHNLILGIDFWESMNIVADFSNKEWHFTSHFRGSHNFCSTVEGIQSTEHLTEVERRTLQTLVNEFFKDEPTTLGRTDRVQHVIDTGDSPAIKQRYFPVSPAKQKLIDEELNNMLTLGVIEPSKSEWSSPIFLLDKPDGSKRFIVDFRKVNAVSKKDAYPLPRVTAILDRLRDARYISSLDIKSAYWQLPLESKSKERTAFTIPGRGLYQFVTMPFGLCGAPATWQRFVDNVLGPDLEPYVFVYLDDIILVTPTFEKHVEVLSEIFKRVREAKLTLNKEKCTFCRQELKYLGYVVSERGLHVDPDKVKSIVDLPVPRNQKEVRQFCGTASWYRRFIKDFAGRMYPLTSLLKRRSQFKWTPEADIAFQDIKACLISAPILTCPDFTHPFAISCDASGYGIGAVLSQNNDVGEVVVAYASRTLSNQEQKYSATERECLAVIFAVEKFRAYVEGTKFTVITDHYSLLWLNNLKDPVGRLARWALRLQPYDFELKHRKGQENVVPDMLSRSTPVKDEPNSEIEVVCASLEIPANITDKWYTDMLKRINEKKDEFQQWRVEGNQLWKNLGELEPLSQEATWRLVIPKEFRSKTIEECHNPPTCGHQGVLKTYKRMQQKFYWPKMRKDIASYIAKCQICQRIKYDQNKPAGMMGELRSVNAPFKMIAADLIGPLPRSLKGFKYLLVVTDTFTKYSILKPLRAATANLVSKHLEEDVFMAYGVPQYIICDNGSEFIGNPVTKLAQNYKIKVLLNASRHPQANPAERVNRDIVTMLRAYIEENHREWDKYIPQMGFALRTAHHETTKHTPAFLTFGRELTVTGAGFDILQEAEIPPLEESKGYGDKLHELKEIYKDVSRRLKEAHNRNAKRYNLRRRQEEFNEGELVLKRNYVQSDASRNFSAKLAHRFVGPFVITKKTSALIYTLADMKGNDKGNWHISDLRKYCQ